MFVGIIRKGFFFFVDLILRDCKFGVFGGYCVKRVCLKKSKGKEEKS